MMKTGIANLPLHSGKAPRWLFNRMVKLSREICEAIIQDYGEEEFINRLSDPYWFQALGNVLGFDWHSSGVTTTVCGALKEALKNSNLGVTACGGKGKSSLYTISEIEKSSLSSKKLEKLIYATKMTAKVDSALVQDNYTLYHHSFFFSEKGHWAVVQQGMNNTNNYARRYHWVGGVKSFVETPHSAICCDEKGSNVLDLTAKDNSNIRKCSLDLVKENPIHLKKYFSKQLTLNKFLGVEEVITRELTMPAHHHIILSNLSEKTILSLKNAYEIQPKNYEELVFLKGIGAKSLRALALVSEIIYGEKIKWEDPVKYSFAHGGKDGVPYPVDKINYDKTILILKEALQNSKIGEKEKINAIKRLRKFI
ncbi:MAG: DUF763 domain-containing protein [Candidatus Woesearchaeota archaeon]